MNIRRDWTGTARRTQATIHTSHPDGEMYRGAIRAARRGQDQAGRMAWTLIDPDHTTAEHVGDYVDAEQALLAMSPDLNHVPRRSDADYLRDYHTELPTINHARDTLARPQENNMSVNTATRPTAPAPNPDAATARLIVDGWSTTLDILDGTGKVRLQRHNLFWEGRDARPDASSWLLTHGYRQTSGWHRRAGHDEWAVPIVIASEHLTRTDR